MTAHLIKKWALQESLNLDDRLHIGSPAVHYCNNVTILGENRFSPHENATKKKMQKEDQLILMGKGDFPASPSGSCQKGTTLYTNEF